MVDVLIENGLVVDGTGSPAFVGGIAIEADRIVRVTRRRRDEPGSAEPAGEVVDATGMTVAPGFIDIHSHSDHTLLVDPRAFSAINQGVTLEVVGNCGFGCFPVGDAELAKSRIYAYHDERPISWRSAHEYFATLEDAQPAINVASLVPNGQLRLAVVGPDTRAATPHEKRTMRDLLEESLDAGAWGLSTCLESGEESSMTEDDVTDLCRSVAAANGVHAIQTRDRADLAAEAIDEGIRTAQRAGARLQVSHLIPDRGMEELERCLHAVDSAVGSSEVTFDMHTRLFGIGYLSAAVPPTVIQGSADAVRARLTDASERDSIRGFRSGLSALGDWSRVVLLDNDVWPDYGRQSIAEIAERRGTNAIDAICDLLAASADDVQRLWTIELTFTEQQQRMTFAHPLCVPASDAAALALDGPLAGDSFHGAYSWVSWFYRYMVREEKLLTPEAAIRKVTGAPASILGITDRGLLQVGHRADIAIFDSEAFADRETMFSPNEPAVGMRDVLVNGTFAMRAGAMTGQRPGMVLRRH